MSAPGIATESAPARAWSGWQHDLRDGCRKVSSQRAHSLVIMATMALGVAAAGVLFAVVYGVVLRPLAWPDADRLVRLYETRRGSTRPATLFTNATYLAWSDRPDTIESIAAYTVDPMTISGHGEVERITVVSASPRLFAVLRVRPALGAAFSVRAGNEDQPADEAEVVLGYGLWQRRYGGQRDVVGRTLRLDGTDYRVAGVMPRDFAFPDREASAWIPFRVPSVIREGGGPGRLKLLNAIARLKAGVTPQQAAAEATARAKTAPNHALAAIAAFGSNGAMQVTAVPLAQALTGDVRPALNVFLVAVALLLLATTGNVATLQLARATARRREIAIRAALGAGSGRLARLVLVENVLLGLGGGVAGLLLAAWLLHALPALLPPDFPRVSDIALDWRVAAVAIGLSLAAGIAVGLVPTLAARRVNLVESLSEDGLAPVGATARTRTVRVRLIIMAAQVAVASVLLLGAVLLTRSLVALVNLDRGYDPTNVLTAVLPLPEGSFTPQQRGDTLGTILQRLERLSGVTYAAYSTRLPLTSGETMAAFPAPPRRSGNGPATAHALLRFVSPGYFKAMGLRIAEGRGFNEMDRHGAARVVVVNREFARQYLDDPAVGGHLPGANEQQDEVIGVVGDVRYGGAEETAQPELYSCACQAGVESFDSVALVLRATGDPARLVSSLRSIVREQAPATTLESVMTMEDRVWASVARPRLYALLLAGFALFTTAIAGIGLFGVSSVSVAQRKRELAVRSSLGAAPASLVRLVLRQALGVALVGLGAGLLMFAGLARFLSSLLFGITPFDAASIAGVALALLLVTVVACAVPARHAAQVDPASVLR